MNPILADEPPQPNELAYQASREVRHSVIRIIAAHLRENAKVSWQGMNFDFTGVTFDGGDFTGANFSGGRTDFDRAVFAERRDLLRRSQVLQRYSHLR